MEGRAVHGMSTIRHLGSDNIFIQYVVFSCDSLKVKNMHFESKVESFIYFVSTSH